jgi:serine/threonine protein kinase/DNA-directed RNA polymerase subunit RPC12/RpoP
MAISIFNCPSCGGALPQNTKADQLVKCPACGSTLLISDWKIGDTTYAVVVSTPTRLYTVSDLLAKDDLCNIYRCTYKADGQEWEGMFRVARQAEDNDLVQNEARILYHFQSSDDYDEYRAFLPLALESFIYQDAGTFRRNQANILSMHHQIASPRELYTLEEVHNYYRNGIHAKDVAWMWRRLLNVLGFIHRSGVVHAAVLPSYILIEPKDHKLALTGWSFAARTSPAPENLKAISMGYETWYPPEVHQKVPPTPALDICLAARSALYLMGLDPLGDASAPSLEPELQRYFARCLDDNPARRPQEAWPLLQEFDDIIENLWGPRQFRIFSMPSKV